MADPAGAATPGAPTPAASPGWVAPAAVLLAVALVTAVVGATWFAVKAVQGFDAERGRDNAVSAAREVAESLTTYDVGTIEADTARLQAGLSTTFTASVEEDRRGVLEKVREGRAKSVGTVTEAGLVEYAAAGDRARVLVSVRAQVTTNELPGGQARDYRMELTMVDQSRWPGGWKAESVEFRS